MGAADAFEADQDKYITSITRTLSPDAIACLKFYGGIQQTNGASSLHSGVALSIFEDDRHLARFDVGTSELLRVRLIWTDWQVGGESDRDAFGMHATDLGWAVITHMWSNLTRPGR